MSVFNVYFLKDSNWDKLCGTDENDKMRQTLWDGGSTFSLISLTLPIFSLKFVSSTDETIFYERRVV